MNTTLIITSLAAVMSFIAVGLLTVVVIQVRQVLRQPERLDLSIGQVTELVGTQQQATATEFSTNRKEFTEQQTLLRGEVSESITKFGDGIQRQSANAATNQREALEAFGNRFHSLNQAVNQSLTDMRSSIEDSLKSLRESFEKSGNTLRNTVDGKLTEIRTDNANKLEQMRVTVDEKLQSTLDKRLGESFNLVNERLEAVHKGLGEMQQLANGVGDLKRVLTNVKTRGGWGEIQLGQLLQEMLAPNQYAENVAVIEGSAARVEYAIKIPTEGGHTWLPVDAKFPKEDYERIVDAADRADKDALEKASKQLELTLKSCAKTIADKYIKTPETTDYAVLYLPTEGLFAEVARRPNLIEFLQSQHRVVIAGPTTFSAVLTSIQLAFKTLAIQQRGDEVWNVLGAAKAEFGKFGGIIDKVSKKITEAGNHLEQVGVRSRAIERTLKGVEELEYDVKPALTLIENEIDDEAEHDHE